MRIETRRLYIRQMTENDFDRVSLIWLERCSTLFEKLADGKESQTKFLQDMWETTHGLPDFPAGRRPVLWPGEHAENRCGSSGIGH